MRRSNLLSKLAAFTSAVMLFTSVAGECLPGAAVFAADPGSGPAEGDFSIAAPVIQYGEDGSNAKGNLDAIFSPRLILDGTELAEGIDYNVSYKFFFEEPELTPENFADTEGIVLSQVPAGSTVYAAACAETEDAKYISTAEVSVVKRRLSISYEGTEDNAIDGRDVSENGICIIPEDCFDYSGFDLSISDGFAYDIDIDELLSGDISLDLSGVDLSEDSYQRLPMEVQLDPAYDDNYELDKNIHGNYYILKAQYYLVFVAGNNGETYTKTYAFPDYEFSGTAKELLDALGKTEEILSTTESGSYDLNGFLDTGSDMLMGWSVYSDGYNTDNNAMYSDYVNDVGSAQVILNPDAVTYEYKRETKEYKLSGKSDYLFVAQISKAAAENLFVSVIPSVTYDSREHVALGTKVNLKKKTPDLRIRVNYSRGNSPYKIEDDCDLIPETDYTVKYYNNINASVSVSENGTYVSLKNGNDRPHAVITGKGKYEGFSATVYFDILPANISDSMTSTYTIHENPYIYDGSSFGNGLRDLPRITIESEPVKMSGLKHTTYELKKGKISKINLQLIKGYRTWNNGYSGKQEYGETKCTLKPDKDYKLELYKYNEEEKSWELQEGISDPSKISTAGSYLIMVRGIGNYCGALFDSEIHQIFSDGRSGVLYPQKDTGSDFQFIVTEDLNYDFEYSTVSIGKRSINYDGLSHNGESFGIVIKRKDKQVLEYGKDYYVEFTRKYRTDRGTDKFAEVTASNVYDVMVYGTGDYYGCKSAKTVSIKGLRLKKTYFIMEGYAVRISDKGKAAKLTMDNTSDPYYVNYEVGGTSGHKLLYIIGGERSGAAIDPSKPVRISKSFPKQPVQKKMSLKQAIDDGIISFKISVSGEYIIKGTMPEYISLGSGGNEYMLEGYQLYNNFKYNRMPIYDKQGSLQGFADIVFTFKNNTKVGKAATVTAKVMNSDVLSGSAVAGTFMVEPRKVSMIYDEKTYGADVLKFLSGVLYSVVTDEQQGKGSLDKPNVKLYQVYIDGKGEKHAVALGTKQYTVCKGKENGENGISTTTYVTNGSEPGFDFEKAVGGEDGVAMGVNSWDYALYGKKLTSAMISSVMINGVEYPVKNGVIDKSFSPAFSGVVLKPDIQSITADGITIKAVHDYSLEYGEVFSAGDKNGTVRIVTHYNRSEDSYALGGTVELKFSIKPAEGIDL